MSRKPTTPLTKIRTGFGDKGETMVGDLKVYKDDPAVQLMGALDSVQVSLGLLYPELGRPLQELVFLLGAFANQCMAFTPDKLALEKTSEKFLAIRERLESYIHESSISLPGFIMSSGTCLAESRVRVRYAETVASTWARRVPRVKTEALLSTLNVLSDYLFVCEYEAEAGQGTEPLYVWTGVDGGIEKVILDESRNEPRYP